MLVPLLSLSQTIRQHESERQMDSNSSYASRMKSKLRDIQSRFVAILQVSRLEYYAREPNPFLNLFSNSPIAPEIEMRWIQLPPDLERKQNQILRDFEEWHTDFCGLFQNVTKDEEMQLKNLYLDVDSLIKYRKVSRTPSSVKEVIEFFEATCDRFVNFLDQLESANEYSSILVVDSSAIIDCPDLSQMAFSLDMGDVTLIVPSTTISELDDLKTGRRDERFRRRLTTAIRKLNDIMEMGNVLEGIQLPNGTIIKMLATEPDFSKLPQWLDPYINDDRILASAIELQRKNPSSYIAVIANDINMKNKASLAGLPVKKIPEMSDDAV